MSRELSEKPAAIAQRERRQQHRDAEHEASREYIREMIARYGLDYNRWPKKRKWENLQEPEAQ